MASAFLFKNGYALLSRTLSVPAGADVVVLKELDVENPCHGTMWFEGTASVVSVHTHIESKTLQRPALSLTELVLANKGEKLSLLVRNPGSASGEGVWYEGVVDVPSHVDTDAPVGVTRQSFAGFFNISDEKLGGVSSIPLEHVVQVRGAKRSVYSRPADSKGLIVRLSPNAAASTLRVMQLSHGLTWAPSYKITLSKEQHARVSGHACILNDSAAISEFATLSCLAGVPNLNFSHVIDPLAQQQQVQEFLANLGSDNSSSRAMQAYGRRNVMSNNMMSQQAYGGYVTADDGDDDDQPTKESADDLFQYRFENVVLPKGSRVLLELFKPVEIEYRDVHQAEVSLAGDHGAAQSTPIDVWHSIKLKNKSTVPWSTGPVLVTRGEEQSLVCQSSVSFTGLNTEAEVKLTKALAVLVNHSEIVDTVKQTTKKVFERSYLRIDTSGSFLLRNQMNVPVSLCLTLKVTGEVVSSSEKPTKSTEVSSGSDLANSSHVLIYDITLKPNEKGLMIKYQRQYWKKAN